MFKNLFSTLFLASLLSCNNGRKEHITGKYYLIYTDSIEDRGVAYEFSEGSFIDVVPEVVTAYGYDEKMIVF